MSASGAGSNEAAALEAASALAGQERYLLRLYVAGGTPHSARAMVNIRKICEEHLPGRYELEIVDLAQSPELAAADQIVAAPTLIKLHPLPRRRFIGDLSRTTQLLASLDLPSKPAQ